MRLTIGKPQEPSPAEVLAPSENGHELTATELLQLAAPSTSRPTSNTPNATKGAIPVDGGATTELGSSVGGITRENLPAFASRAQAIRLYDQMANDDAAIDISLRASKMPILGANFFIQAASDDPVDLIAAEFVEDNLTKGLAAPFALALEDILRFYEYGFSALEKVFENREWASKKKGANRKVYTMLAKLAPRPTPTLGAITYDNNGGPLEIIQNAVQGDGSTKEVKLGIEKLIIFTHNRKGGNLEGKSILRTSYKHWFYKNNLYTIDGIQKERHGMGFPTLTLPMNYTKADLEAARKLVRNIRTNEEAGAVLPPGFILAFAEMKGQPVNVMGSIDHHNGMILLNVMVQFLSSGISDVASGGRATSASAQDMFTKSLRFFGNMICDMVNYYIIPQLVGYNFTVTRYPMMRVRNIGETKDLQQWASAIGSLLARNAMTMDFDTEQWVREIADAPLKLGTVQTPEANTPPKGPGINPSKGEQRPADQTAGGTGNAGQGNNPPQNTK